MGRVFLACLLLAGLGAAGCGKEEAPPSSEPPRTQRLPGPKKGTSQKPSTPGIPKAKEKEQEK